MRFTGALLVLSLAASCVSRHSPPARQPELEQVRRAERSLGLEPTENFRRSASGKSYSACYFTGILQLPDSYDGLKEKKPGPKGCDVDEKKYDLFFYPMEAVAFRDAPVTGALEESTPERFRVVVAHEDVHEQPSVDRLPRRMAEAASTLGGFLAAAEAARLADGENSEQHQTAISDVEGYLAKSKVVNRYHERLSALYDQQRSGGVSKAGALEQKALAFEQLGQECRSAVGRSESFNSCPAALNNAGLAFDLTYTRFYPLFFDLYVKAGRNAKRFFEALEAIPTSATANEQKAINYLTELVGR